MGIDTNAILTKAPSPTELLIWAESNYRNANLTSVPGVSDMFFLNFMDGDDQRHLTVFIDNCVASDYKELYTGHATFIVMRMWGNSELIARKLVYEFGGWFRVNDCQDDWKRLDED